MNKKEFEYYKENRNEITPELLGKMFLYAEGYTMDSYLKGDMVNILSDSEIADIVNSMPNRPDWIDFRFYIALVNTIRLYKQIMHTRVWELEYSILVLIHTLGSLYMEKELEQIGSRCKFTKVEEILNYRRLEKNKESASEKTLREQVLKIEACLRWILAHNDFIDIVMKLEGVNTIKSFKKNIEDIELDLANCNRYVYELTKEQISQYPLKEFKLSSYKPKKENKEKVIEDLKDKTFFLKGTDRIDSYLLQKLIFGKVI